MISVVGPDNPLSVDWKVDGESIELAHIRMLQVAFLDMDVRFTSVYRLAASAESPSNLRTSTVDPGCPRRATAFHFLLCATHP